MRRKLSRCFESNPHASASKVSRFRLSLVLVSCWIFKTSSLPLNLIQSHCLIRVGAKMLACFFLRSKSYFNVVSENMHSHLLDSGAEIFSSLPYIPTRLLSPDLFNIKKQLSSFSINNNDRDGEDEKVNIVTNTPSQILRTPSTSSQ